MLWVAFVVIHVITGGVFSVLWHCLLRLSLPFLGRVSQSLTHRPPILKLFSLPLSLLPSEYSCVYRSMCPCGTRRQSQVYFLRLSLHIFFCPVFCQPGTCRGILWSAFPMLRLQGHTTMPSLLACLLYLFNYLSIYLL